ncbi:predicted protein [Uncinocarpus reesii 1704]|uniref:Uncharacterized protein n=1 Tax=Uncinocarpus reesii (strain UAMH 1704) TaxID=336963 RepID=C4JWL6_UNCRE|nr:uncharacterized protein UREG_06958 [Uncinocarpus reesii 1704]EEP82093.1 predicted protein [Uncinocarpus reesii 1704]
MATNLLLLTWTYFDTKRHQSPFGFKRGTSLRTRNKDGVSPEAQTKIRDNRTLEPS